jgi:hypothetical protein
LRTVVGNGGCGPPDWPARQGPWADSIESAHQFEFLITFQYIVQYVVCSAERDGDKIAAIPGLARAIGVL